MSTPMPPSGSMPSDPGAMSSSSPSGGSSPSPSLEPGSNQQNSDSSNSNQKNQRDPDSEAVKQGVSMGLQSGALGVPVPAPIADAIGEKVADKYDEVKKGLAGKVDKAIQGGVNTLGGSDAFAKAGGESEESASAKSSSFNGEDAAAIGNVAGDTFEAGKQQFTAAASGKQEEAPSNDQGLDQKQSSTPSPKMSGP